MPEAVSSPTWQERITGRWALSWQSFVLGVAVNVPLLVLTGGRIGTRVVPIADMGVLAAYGVVASALVGGWALLMNATLMHHRRVRPVALWRFVLLHAVSGAIFGAAVVLADQRLGVSLGVPAVMTVALTIGLGLWWGVTTAMVFEARDRFLDQRARLLDEAVFAQLASIEDSRVAVAIAEETASARSDVTNQLVRARAEMRARVEDLGTLADWLEVAQRMRSTADATVRRLSHALWEEASRRYPEPRAAGVLSMLLREPTFLPLPAASVIVIGYVGATTQGYGPVLGPALALGLGLIAWALLSVGNAAIRRWHGWRYAVYFIALSAVQVATLTLAYGPAGAVGESVPPSLVAGSILGTLISIVLTSIVASLDASRAVVMEQLRRTVDTERILQAARSRSRSLALRELAQELHGTVQTRLIACASGVEIAARSGDFAACFEAMRESERVLGEIRVEEAVSLDKRLTALARSWSAMCAVDITIDAAIGSRASSDVARVVEEAIANAYRHGGATRVDVEVGAAGDGVEIRVRDDGSGPAGGPPGMGSDLLSRATGGSFDLGPAPGGGALLVAHLPAGRAGRTA